MEQAIDRMQLLTEWWTTQNQLQGLKEKEMNLRKEVQRYFFPEPMEGRNRVNIGNNFDLVLDYKIDVKMDYKAFDELCRSEEAEELGIVKSDVVEYKPNFKESAFKKLNETKQDFIEQVLTRKPAAPSMKIERGKKKDDELVQAVVQDSVPVQNPESWAPISKEVVFQNGYKWAKEQIEAGVDISDLDLYLSQLNDAEDFVAGADNYLNGLA